METELRIITQFVSHRTSERDAIWLAALHYKLKPYVFMTGK